MQYFLGIDAGGTKTDFLLGDDYRTLARVRTGTIKRMRAGEKTVEANLVDALRQLTAATGISMQSIARCCIGTAGQTVPLVTDWLRLAFARHIGGELVLIGDVEIALDAAFFGERGVLVLAGTGSNVAGRTSTGTVLTAGGWGPAMADQGSGHFIGLESLRRGFLAVDERRPTRLLDEVQTYWNLASIGDLIELANANPAPDFSRLVPLVVACAERGDLVAQEVLNQCGVELAYLAGLVIERIRDAEADSAKALNGNSLAPFEFPGVAIAGSILEHVALVRKALEASLGNRFPGIKILDDPVDPAVGALWGARHRGSDTTQKATSSRTQ